MYCTRHRVFLAALICAAKYLNDSSPKNKHWQRYAALFSLAEVNLMEKQLLYLLDYDLRVTEPELLVHYAPFIRANRERRAVALARRQGATEELQTGTVRRALATAATATPIKTTQQQNVHYQKVGAGPSRQVLLPTPSAMDPPPALIERSSYNVLDGSSSSLSSSSSDEDDSTGSDTSPRLELHHQRIQQQQQQYRHLAASHGGAPPLYRSLPVLKPKPTHSPVQALAASLSSATLVPDKPQAPPRATLRQYHLPQRHHLYNHHPAADGNRHFPLSPTSSFSSDDGASSAEDSPPLPNPPQLRSRQPTLAQQRVVSAPRATATRSSQLPPPSVIRPRGSFANLVASAGGWTRLMGGGGSHHRSQVKTHHGVRVVGVDGELLH